MHTSPPIPHGFATVLMASVMAIAAGTGAAEAEQLCFPHCDYTHYYGPYDYTYIRDGLFGYPQCGPQGDCAPHPVYTTGVLRPIPTGRIRVRFLPPRRP